MKYELPDNLLLGLVKKFVVCKCKHGFKNAAGHALNDDDGDQVCINVYHYPINTEKARKAGVIFPEDFSGEFAESNVRKTARKELLNLKRQHNNKYMLGPLHFYFD